MNGSLAHQIGHEFCQQSVELLNQSEIKTRHCLAQLSDEQVWWRPEPSMNSIGNLIIHMAGNLVQWGIVSVTGEKDQRDRASEFAAKEICSQQELLDQMSATIEQATSLWNQLESDRLTERTSIQGFEVSFLQAIMHTSSHFAGHAQQIILLTRLQLGTKYKFHWTPEGDRGSLPI